MIPKERRDRAFILRTISLVESKKRKGHFLKELGISRGTYYFWRRLLKAKGKDAITGLVDLTWKSGEIRIISDYFKKKALLSIYDLKQKLPKRSAKAIEARVKEMGLSFRNHNRLFSQQRRTKRCARCKMVRPIENYYKVKFESLDGRHVFCKRCILISQRAYKYKNRERIQKREHNRRLRLRSIDPHYSTKTNTRWRQTAKGAYATIKNRSISKSRRGSAQFDISYKDFLFWYNNEKKLCRYCGISLKEFLLIRHNLFGIAQRTNVLTIDRLDSNIPYQRGNLGFACYLCNHCKGYVFSDTEFKDIAERFIKPRLMRYLEEVPK